MDFGLLGPISQWAMYFLPSIVLWIRLRMGKKVGTSLGYCLILNLLGGWTVVVWVLLMCEAFGYEPIPWLVFKLTKVLPGSAGTPVNAQQGAWDSSAQSQVCTHCGGSRSMTCSQCQGRGSWYTQPTSAHETAQLQNCSYCQSSGRIRCQYCLG